MGVVITNRLSLGCGFYHSNAQRLPRSLITVLLPSYILDPVYLPHLDAVAVG